MRRSVAAIIVVTILALLLTACGSSSDSATPAAATGTQTGGSTQPQTPPPTAQPRTPSAQDSETKEPGVPRPFEVDEETPAFFTAALKQKKAILVLFYNPDEAVSKIVLKEAAEAYKPYEKSVVLLLLRAGKDEDIAGLARQFEVDFLPFVAALDRRGNIVFQKTGYIDSKVFELALYRALSK